MQSSAHSAALIRANDYHANAVSGGYYSNRGLQLRTQKLQRLPITVNVEEFYEYGGKAVCSNHVFNFKIGESNSHVSFQSCSREGGGPAHGCAALFQPKVHASGR